MLSDFSKKLKKTAQNTLQVVIILFSCLKENALSGGFSAKLKKNSLQFY